MCEQEPKLRRLHDWVTQLLPDNSKRSQVDLSRPFGPVMNRISAPAVQLDISVANSSSIGLFQGAVDETEG